ncbi:MAG TPA: lysophospholipid acyltransferase family protein [Candidatus Obscuribacterales bacterium]
MLEILFRSLAGILGRSGRRPAQMIASGLAGLIYGIYRLSPYRDFIAGNIRAALPQADADALAQTHLRLLLWAIVDLLRFRRFGSAPVLPPEVTVTGWEHFEAAHALGRGVILVSAHFGCWELIPACIGLRGLPVTVLVQKPSQDAFDRLFREFRAFAGVRTLNNDSLAGLRPVLRSLRRGETVGLVIDQHGESERLIGHFFGHRVSMPEGPAFLAGHLATPIVPVLTRWRGSRHVLEFFPALEARGAQTDQQAELMQRIYDWLEAQIRRYPENWLWSYNRWDKLRDKGRGARDEGGNEVGTEAARGEGGGL